MEWTRSDACEIRCCHLRKVASSPANKSLSCSLSLSLLGLGRVSVPGPRGPPNVLLGARGVRKEYSLSLSLSLSLSTGTGEAGQAPLPRARTRALSCSLLFSLSLSPTRQKRQAVTYPFARAFFFFPRASGACQTPRLLGTPRFMGLSGRCEKVAGVSGFL